MKEKLIQRCIEILIMLIFLVPDLFRVDTLPFSYSVCECVIVYSERCAVSVLSLVSVVG